MPATQAFQPSETYAQNARIFRCKNLIRILPYASRFALSVFFVGFVLGSWRMMFGGLCSRN